MHSKGHRHIGYWFRIRKYLHPKKKIKISHFFAILCQNHKKVSAMQYLVIKRNTCVNNITFLVTLIGAGGSQYLNIFLYYHCRNSKCCKIYFRHFPLFQNINQYNKIIIWFQRQYEGQKYINTSRQRSVTVVQLSSFKCKLRTELVMVRNINLYLDKDYLEMGEKTY